MTYTRIGVVSNGYVVLGGGTAADINFINQNLPNPARPNNVLAPFWTDLNPSAGGAVRIGTLTDGTNTWLIVDWEAVKDFRDADLNRSRSGSARRRRGRRRSRTAKWGTAMAVSLRSAPRMQPALPA